MAGQFSKKVASIACLALSAAVSHAASFGLPVAIGGHASDVALDERRGVLYIANYTANRIEVMSTDRFTIQTSMNVAPQPGALALSPDGRFLVVAHYGNFASPNSPRNALTVIEIDSGAKQTFSLASPPLGVAFGFDDLALVATTSEFFLFDPVSGAVDLLTSIEALAAKTLPQPQPSFPPQIIAASMAASGDMKFIYGLSDTFRFRYSVQNRGLSILGYTSSPPMGPRAVSVNRTGTQYLAGWGNFDSRGVLIAQFPNPAGLLNVGSHAIDSTSGVVYAQIPEGAPQTAEPATPATPPATPTPPAPAAPAQPPVLQVLDADNLTVRERLQLPENLAGKSVLSASGEVMYSVSDSGVLVLPVGRLREAHRLASSHEDVVFQGNFCDRRVATQEITIFDPGGGRTDFSLRASAAGVNFSPAAGVTPATVRVSVDPSVFQNHKGTVAISAEIRSVSAVNLPAPIRILINNREPDQRGTVVNTPGRLVDLLADPVRSRVYVLRQDRNEVLVFDAGSNRQIGSLRTGNTPAGMAITFDRKYLLIGADNSQIAHVYDLDTLEVQQPIIFPPGHYPRSIACSGRSCIAATRVAGPIHQIDRIDLISKTAVAFPTLGVYANDVHLNTVLAASPSGATILAAMADGRVLLYDANVDSFTIARKDFTELSGAYAASPFDTYFVGNALLNSSLVVLNRMETASGKSSGFSFVDQGAFRAVSPDAAAAGVIQRVNLERAEGMRTTRTIESPLTGDLANAFTRTLAPLYNRTAIVLLTTSGYTVLPWTYDAAVAPPRLERIVNAADRDQPVAPGSLISIYGRDLSPVNVATREIPLPTALGESCLTVNGVPVPMLFVSSTQINGQLPYNVEGNATMILRTPGGVSDNLNFRILPAAASVFRAPDTDLPTIYRAKNREVVTLSNPIHPEDELVIYATGLGRTAPAVEAGVPAPSDPLPVALIEPEVTLGSVALPIHYAGLVPGEIGVFQINVSVPYWAPAGMQIPLAIRQGGHVTTLPVRVVK
jgi:uncharacterized protein (TIGR03437 family)